MDQGPHTPDLGQESGLDVRPRVVEVAHLEGIRRRKGLTPPRRTFWGIY